MDHHVCVVGGGYAGLRTLRVLASLLGAEWRISLVDRLSHHQLITRLPELVSGTVPLERVQVPFARVLPARVHHVQADVLSVDIAQRVVRTPLGDMRADFLVLALGTRPDYDAIPGSDQYSLAVKSVAGAVRLRDTLAQLLPTRVVVNIVLIGAGYTATEVAGQLTAMNLGPAAGASAAHINLQIVAEDSRLLPQASERLSTGVATVLARRNVDVALQKHVAGVDATGILTADGEHFGADLVVWAAQSRGVVAQTGSRLGHAALDRVKVDPYLRADYDDHVFACGDAAEIVDYTTGRIVPSSAQLAVQEGDLVARNVYAAIRGKLMQEFRPRNLGEALDLGAHDAVAEVTGVLLTGRAAAAVKRAALVRYLASLNVA